LSPARGHKGRAGAAAALLSALALPAPAAAFESRDLMCMATRQAEGGGFTVSGAPGLSVRALAAAPGPFVHDLGADVVAFTCMRSEVMPEVGDVEVLQAGLELYLGSMRTGTRMIKLALTGGRVRFEVLQGSLNGGERRSLDRIVAAMQARVDAAAATAATPAR
jgi:hypothetical protein